ncbi:TLD-domain-containing protein [Sphaerosporella brunnea]|uniref:Oxidation resistance protein 1 n=1 Tax=Sphaerosporella brunnea TaxID=1250544 RepID=A0A5J5F292_9PEZI|nr:TLD-domain-containing protein [Sphaerosporella brunnea]
MEQQPASASPSRGSSYGALPSLTSALTWTFNRLTSTDSSHGHQRSNSVPVYESGPARRSSPFAPPPPLPPLHITGYALTTANRILSRTLAEEIRLLLPARLQLYDTWTLAYSLEQHGVSLATLYKCAQEKKGAFVLVVKDSLGGIFGAFVNEAFRPSGGRYYGTGECFLWKAAILPPPPEGSTPEPEPGEDDDGGFSKAAREERTRFKAFPYSGINDYMILCDNHFLSMGGGDGKYGLWLDDTFEKGVSNCCPTFGNEPLSEDTGGKFEILDVELWRIGN